jgi:hypothetical protein
MFESNMLDNIAQQSILKVIRGDISNTWRKLVTKEYESFLDSLSTKQETTEDNCDE